ncbi:bacteriocin immunity protein [Pantoea sp. Ap-967]|uniref:bacteriocin immunity protein n=1 Tax=Pantoea sp. Ap-967 TaxID=2608362 RepID=UPI0014225801|nr:bacteriocin immunity protein [Pantoea sp. Ap-967]NIE74553.1 bacteriocin immunity protein [Pantoea sp. Ap-967]
MRQFSDYTEKEFYDFLNGIYRVDVYLYPTERSHIDAVIDFERLTGHPVGSDLISKPKKFGIEDAPRAMLNEVMRWRAEQGLPGFKDS